MRILEELLDFDVHGLGIDFDSPEYRETEQGFGRQYAELARGTLGKRSEILLKIGVV